MGVRQREAGEIQVTTTRILVACEESQVVTASFRSMGVDAFSCDLLPCSGGHPEWHIREDVEIVVSREDWDAVIAFPPCTDLASSGARWFSTKKEDGRQQESMRFFMVFADLECKHVAIENPIGIMSTEWRRPDQIIQPWQFGHGETKATCLWLKNLPPLVPTNIVPGRENRVWRMPPSPNRGILRSRTYPGIASAMAVQWIDSIKGT